MGDLRLNISSSPHFFANRSTQKIMLCVLISLLPDCIAGLVFFGFRALLTILISVIGAVAFEALFRLITKQKILIKNLSAAVSGVLIALVLPPTVPFWMLLLADFVAMVVAKGLFGGIGSNTFNPALTGRAVLFISFPAAIGASWIDPIARKAGMDAVTSATLLSGIKNASITPANFDYLQAFLGNRAGCIGETSILAILISFVLLLVSGIIDWRAPLTMVGTVIVCTFCRALALGSSFVLSCQEVLISLLTGGLLFGATFMVTDYATTPVTQPGRLIFGFGCGLITWLIRTFGGYPEGVMFSILIMNAFAPLLNNLIRRMYGYGKKGNQKAEAKKIVQNFDLKNSKEIKDSKEEK